MELTDHGLERIQGRTQLVPSDVLSIIANDAVVYLGSRNQYEFLLFYSPLDHCTKIAVVAEQRSCLVSVWEAYFKLPLGVRPADSHRKRKAYKLLREYQFRQIKENLKPRTVKIVVQTLLRDTIIAEQDPVEIVPVNASDQLQSYLPSIRPALVQLVEECGKKFARLRELKYRFLLLDVATGAERLSFVVKHKRMKLYLEYGS